jgi:tRNA threonylcarbamoyladenosine biosynthesis protein TsaE
MIVASPDDMLQKGREFAARLSPGDVVTLHGNLGAGKTLFCKGVLAGLGFEGDVQSPTFTIANQYDPPDVALAIIHADLYRLNTPDELGELGLLDAQAIRLIEWAEKGGDAFQHARFRVEIERMEDDTRNMTITEII